MDAASARTRNNASGGLFGRLRPYVWLLAFLLLTLLIIRIAQPQVELTAATHLFLHNAVEMFSIIVAALIFALGWHVQREDPHGPTTLLGPAFLAVALLDFFHMLSYLGMPAVVTPSSAEKAIAFWLVARLVAAVALLAIALRPSPPSVGTRWLFLAGAIALGAAATAVILFFPDVLPRTFIAGAGLTPFKVVFEYVLVGLYVAAGVLLIAPRNRSTVDAPDMHTSLAAAAMVAAMSEVFFTFYASVYDIYNLAGHVYKVIAYYLVYRALFVGTLRASSRTASTLRERLHDSEEHRNEALEARSETESRLQSVIDTAMDAIVTVDEEQHIALFNHAAERIFGCRAADAIGKPLDRFLPARFRHAHHAHIQRFGATGRTERVMGGGRALYGLRANGEEFPIDASISHTTSQGKPLYTVILRDITDTNRMQDELHLAEQRWRQALHAGALGVFEWDAVTHRVYRSERYLQILGLSNAAIESSPQGWLDFLHPDDRARASRVSPAGGADIPDQFTEELRMLRPDGAERWIAVNGLVTRRDAAGMPQHMIGTVTDITDRQRNQQRLRELIAREQTEIDEERKRIARALHDELGQTLTALRLDIDELKARLDNQARVQDVIGCMDQLVANGLGEMRRLIGALRPQLLDDLGVAAAAAYLVEQTGVRLGIRAGFREEGEFADLPATLQVTLYRIVQEALTNIAKHAEAESIDVILARTDSEVRVHVRDDGQGFSSGMPHKPGSFGLSGMQERAALAGGTVIVQSAPGEGTTIMARFPLAPDERMDRLLH
ncbi:MAG: MASE3 domain-containing protein [Burkholderiales bacterium]